MNPADKDNLGRGHSRFTTAVDSTSTSADCFGKVASIDAQKTSKTLTEWLRKRENSNVTAWSRRKR